MNTVLAYIEGFVSLFYPKLCLACNISLTGNEEILCTTCRLTLPETNFHNNRNNPVEQIFWGRLQIENATSLLFFDKGSKYRRLLHQLKYKGNRKVGYSLGKLLGTRILQTGMCDPDIIIPIPLHRIKFKRRGYNQSEEIANGLASVLNKPVIIKSLIRVKHSTSQTSRGRYDRWVNSESIFDVVHSELIKDRHILLVDDIVTTGATLEAAGACILRVDGTRLSIATLAYTS